MTIKNNTLIFIFTGAEKILLSFFCCSPVMNYFYAIFLDFLKLCTCKFIPNVCDMALAGVP